MKDRKTVPLSEQPCYTLISQPNDAEQPSEIQLKSDLGKKEEFRIVYLIMNYGFMNCDIHQVNYYTCSLLPCRERRFKN